MYTVEDELKFDTPVVLPALANSPKKCRRYLSIVTGIRQTKNFSNFKLRIWTRNESTFGIGAIRPD